MENTPAMLDINSVIDNICEGYEETFEREDGFTMTVEYNQHEDKPFICNVKGPNSGKIFTKAHKSADALYFYISSNGYVRTTK